MNYIDLRRVKAVKQIRKSRDIGKRISQSVRDLSYQHTAVQRRNMDITEELSRRLRVFKMCFLIVLFESQDETESETKTSKETSN